MDRFEVPSDDEVVDVLRAIGPDGATARQLCERLVANGHPLRQSQLAIQRATERRRLRVASDWRLSVEPERAVA